MQRAAIPLLLSVYFYTVQFKDLLKHLPDNENRLLQLISKGDKMAFTQLFDRYKDSLYYLTWTLTRSTSICDDVLQEAFLRVWLHRSKLAEIKNFPVYLAVIGKRIILNELRRSNRALNNEMLARREWEQQHNGHTISDRVATKQYETLLQTAMQQLPAQQASVFRLIKLHGYTRHEAATALGLSPETVKKHLERAMRSVREFLLTRLDNMDSLFLLIFFSINSSSM